MANFCLYIFCVVIFVRISKLDAYKYSSFSGERSGEVLRLKKVTSPKSAKNGENAVFARKTENLPKNVKKSSSQRHRHMPDEQKSYDLEEYFEKFEDIEFNEGYNSIETADENRVEEILGENDKNLVLFFHDKDNKCPDCRQALDKMEEIDEELESAKYIEVVKSKDKLLAGELGIFKLPAMVYFRRRHPILYDGDFQDSQEIYRWVRSHDQVTAVDLEDRNFEDYTDSHSPTGGTLDWFILFYNSKNVECNSYVPLWESVAYQLRGYVNVGRVDIHKSDDVAHRFGIDDEDDCPTFLLLRRGKMYKYKNGVRDLDSLKSFALQKYKEQRGKRVPEPPTLIRELFEEFKEYLGNKLVENTTKMLTVIGIVAAISTLGLIFWFVKRKNRQKELTESQENKKDT